MHGEARQLSLTWQGATGAAMGAASSAACDTVLRLLLARGVMGATDDEIARALGWSPQRAFLHRAALVDRGQVVQPVPFARAQRLSVMSPGVRVWVWIASQYAAFW